MPLSFGLDGHITRAVNLHDSKSSSTSLLDLPILPVVAHFPLLQPFIIMPHEFRCLLMRYMLHLGFPFLVFLPEPLPS
jgi:hypothetical protein